MPDLAARIDQLARLAGTFTLRSGAVASESGSSDSGSGCPTGAVDAVAAS